MQTKNVFFKFHSKISSKDNSSSKISSLFRKFLSFNSTSSFSRELHLKFIVTSPTSIPHLAVAIFSLFPLETFFFLLPTKFQNLNQKTRRKIPEIFSNHFETQFCNQHFSPAAIALWRSCDGLTVYKK